MWSLLAFYSQRNVMSVGCVGWVRVIRHWPVYHQSCL